MDFADLKHPAPAEWKDRPGQIVLEGIVGSRAHGLAGENSDTDRRGVFIAPSVEFFGLDDVQETADNPYSDEVLHELGRFVRQALKANPGAIELLKAIHRGGDRTPKAARHMARLLITGYGLWYSGTLRASLPDPDFVRHFEEKVAAGETSIADEMLGHYEKLFAETPTVLPEQPDREKVDAWLKDTRQRALGGVKAP
jgi:hypothetical protein